MLLSTAHPLEVLDADETLEDEIYSENLTAIEAPLVEIGHRQQAEPCAATLPVNAFYSPVRSVNLLRVKRSRHVIFPSCLSARKPHLQRTPTESPVADLSCVS
jgi:hypothetical protein